MTRIIDTANLNSEPMTEDERHEVYNALDCCLTWEIKHKIEEQHKATRETGVAGPGWGMIYNFERALQAPYLDLMKRGFAVDGSALEYAKEELETRIAALRATLDTLTLAAAGRVINPHSTHPKQMRELLYDSMQLPEKWTFQKGVRKLSFNRETLEHLCVYLEARPILSTLLAIRDLAKQREVFDSAVDSRGRFRASYNIAGTETGRPSSSSNAFGDGRNAQNIAPGLRYVFTADRGKRLAVIDLEQVEARDVGFIIGCLFGDWSFLDACESGDLHTNNARLVWPELPWPGDAKGNRAVADGFFYRDFTYRDMAKRGGHLSNYYGRPFQMARSLKIPVSVAEEFQARYCRGGEIGGRKIIPAWPGIPQWWQWIATELQTRQFLLTPFGDKRHFFGRPEADETLREGIAFVPQSMTARRVNLWLWRLWKHERHRIELLAQTHDSITFQYDERLDEDTIISAAMAHAEIPLFAPNGRRYVVPGEAKVGWNWGAAVTQEDREKSIAKNTARRAAGESQTKVPRVNLDGLKKWKRGAADSRSRHVGLGRMMG